MRRALSVFILVSLSVPTFAADLKCRITHYTLAPHQSTSAKSFLQKADTTVADWQQCYREALVAAKEYNFAYEDYVLNGGIGDLFSGDAGTPLLAGYIYYFVQWTVNDSIVGFLNGTSGKLNEFSPDEPAQGDRRVDYEGRPFLEK